MDRLAENIASIREARLAILDGGFATHLEDAYGQDLSGRLWSASLLLDNKEGCDGPSSTASSSGAATENLSGRELIKATHRDFIEAGADIILTSTYQASRLAFELACYSDKLADELLVQSVGLAAQVRSEDERGQGRKRTLVGLSLGPFGAALANGSEYTGDYFLPTKQSPKSGPTPSLLDLEQFHLQRLQTIFGSAQAEAVDVVAFETIPRLDEAIAARRATSKIRAKMGEGVVVYASFVFPDGTRLPYPPLAQTDARQQDHFADLLAATLGKQQDESEAGAPLDGIGINCTKPYYIRPLVQSLTDALTKLQEQGVIRKQPYLFLYPDGGLVWDGQARKWRPAANGPSNNDVDCGAWASQLVNVAKDVLRVSTPEDQEATGRGLGWKAVILGGCCKASVSDIAALRNLTG